MTHQQLIQFLEAFSNERHNNNTLDFNYFRKWLKTNLQQSISKYHEEQDEGELLCTACGNLENVQQQPTAACQ